MFEAKFIREYSFGSLFDDKFEKEYSKWRQVHEREYHRVQKILKVITDLLLIDVWNIVGLEIANIAFVTLENQGQDHGIWKDMKSSCFIAEIRTKIYFVLYQLSV